MSIYTSVMKGFNINPYTKTLNTNQGNSNNSNSGSSVERIYDDRMAAIERFENRNNPDHEFKYYYTDNSANRFRSNAHWKEDNLRYHTEKRGMLDRVFSMLGYGGIVEGLYNLTDDDENTTFGQGLVEGFKYMNPFEDDVTSRNTFSDVLENLGWEDNEDGKPNIGRGIASFVGDVLLDPLTFLNPYASAGKVLKGTGVTLKDVDKVRKAVKAAEVSGKIQDGVDVGSKINKLANITLDDAKKIVQESNPQYSPERVESEAIKVLDGYASKVKGLRDSGQGEGFSFGLNNAVPFADKIKIGDKTLASFSKQFASSDKLRSFGDKTIAPYYNSLVNTIKTSKLASHFSNSSKLARLEKAEGSLSSLEKFYNDYLFKSTSKAEDNLKDIADADYIRNWFNEHPEYTNLQFIKDHEDGVFAAAIRFEELRLDALEKYSKKASLVDSKKQEINEIIKTKQSEIEKLKNFVDSVFKISVEEVSNADYTNARTIIDRYSEVSRLRNDSASRLDELKKQGKSLLDENGISVNAEEYLTPENKIDKYGSENEFIQSEIDVDTEHSNKALYDNLAKETGLDTININSDNFPVEYYEKNGKIVTDSLGNPKISIKSKRILINSINEKLFKNNNISKNNYLNVNNITDEQFFDVYSDIATKDWVSLFNHLENYFGLEIIDNKVFFPNILKSSQKYEKWTQIGNQKFITDKNLSNFNLSPENNLYEYKASNGFSKEYPVDPYLDYYASVEDIFKKYVVDIQDMYGAHPDTLGSFEKRNIVDTFSILEEYYGENIDWTDVMRRYYSLFDNKNNLFALKKQAAEKSNSTNVFKKEFLSLPFEDRNNILQSIKKDAIDESSSFVIDYVKNNGLSLLDKNIDNFTESQLNSFLIIYKRPLMKAVLNANIPPDKINLYNKAAREIYKSLALDVKNKKVLSKTNADELIKSSNDVPAEQIPVVDLSKTSLDMEKLANDIVTERETLSKLENELSELSEELPYAEITNAEYLESLSRQNELELKEFDYDKDKIISTINDLDNEITKLKDEAGKLTLEDISLYTDKYIFSKLNVTNDVFNRAKSLSEKEEYMEIHKYFADRMFQAVEDELKFIYKDSKSYEQLKKACSKLKNKYVPHLYSDEFTSLKFATSTLIQETGKFNPSVHGKKRKFDIKPYKDTISTLEDKHLRNLIAKEIRNVVKEQHISIDDATSKVLKTFESDKVVKIFKQNVADIYLERAIGSNELLYSNNVNNFIKNQLCTKYNGEVTKDKVVAHYMDVEKGLSEYFYSNKKLRDSVSFSDFKSSVFKSAKLDYSLIGLNTPYFELTEEQCKALNKYCPENFKIDMYNMDDYVFNAVNTYTKEQMESMKSGMMKLFDIFQNHWKLLNTVVNPGFHLQNSISNAFQSFLAVGADAFNPAKIKRAHTVITTRDPKQFLTLNGKKYSYKQLSDVIQEYNVIDNTFFKEEISSGMYNFLPYKLGAKVGSSIEGTQRTTLFLSLVDQGKSFEEAAEGVNKFLFDYSDLTEFEKGTMRRILPFYTFMRKNVPLMLEQMFIEQPNTFNTLNKGITNIEKMNEDYIDENYRNPYRQDYIQLPFGIGENEYGDVQYGISNQLPYTQLDRVFDLQKLAGQTSPFIKTPIELLTGTNIYTGMPTDNIAEYLVQQFPFSKIPYNSIKSKEKGTERNLYILGQLAGFPINQIKPMTYYEDYGDYWEDMFK